MSAFGTKRTSLVAPHMSAFGGKADMTFRAAMSAFDPKRTLDAGNITFSMRVHFPHGPLDHFLLRLIEIKANHGEWPQNIEH